eukprot:9468903-Pyramimonas_sp.AAC.1
MPQRSMSSCSVAISAAKARGGRRSRSARAQPVEALQRLRGTGQLVGALLREGRPELGPRCARARGLPDVYSIGPQLVQVVHHRATNELSRGERQAQGACPALEVGDPREVHRARPLGDRVRLQE